MSIVSSSNGNRVGRPRWVVGLAAVAMLVLPATTSVAGTTDMLILASASPELPEGGVIDGTQSLTLPKGVTLTLLSQAGEMLRLAGPYSGAPMAESVPDDRGLGERMFAAMSRLLMGGSKNMGTLGVTRGDTKLADDISLVNAGASTTHCLPAGAVPVLWRPVADKDMRFSMKLARGKRVKTTWPAGQDTLPWPEKVPLRNDGTYVMSGKGIVGYKLKIRMMPDDLPTVYHRIGWMAENGCRRQARKELAAQLGDDNAQVAAAN